MTTTHKNQVGQAGTGVNGGEFAKRAPTADAVALEGYEWRDDDQEEGAEATGDRAAAIAPGATRVRIVDGYGGALAADITYPPFDLKAQLKPLYDGLQDPDEDTFEEFLEAHRKRIEFEFAALGWEVEGDWENATVTQTVLLTDEVATSFGHVAEKVAKDGEARDLAAAARGEDDALYGFRDSLMENSCTNCFADLNDGEGYDGYCGDCADRNEADEDEDED